jgi:hypothetical protein
MNDNDTCLILEKSVKISHRFFCRKSLWLTGDFFHSVFKLKEITK